MRAVEIARPGGPDVLVLTSRPVPTTGPDEILVAVRAAGVNRPDVNQREGRYPPPPGASDLPGLEIAGQVVERGERARRFDVGDRVCALVAGGGYAEYCAVPEVQAEARTRTLVSPPTDPNHCPLAVVLVTCAPPEVAGTKRIANQSVPLIVPSN